MLQIIGKERLPRFRLVRGPRRVLVKNVESTRDGGLGALDVLARKAWQVVCPSSEDLDVAEW
jgi:hypothetical protein